MFLDGALQAEAFPGGSALAFAAKPAAFPFRLHALANVLPIGIGQADLLFGRTTLNDYYVLAYGKGFLTLLHHADKYETLANAPYDPNLFMPGTHLLEADIDVHSIQARLDGKILATMLLSNGSFPKGQWGVGACDGRIIFRNVSVEPFPGVE